MSSESMELASAEDMVRIFQLANGFINACNVLHSGVEPQKSLVCAAIVEAAARYSVFVLSSTYQPTEAEIREAADNFASRMRNFAETQRARIGALN